MGWGRELPLNRMTSCLIGAVDQEKPTLLTHTRQLLLLQRVEFTISTQLTETLF
jgi:hypothetical protein